MKLLDFNKVLRDFQYKPNFAYGAYEREGQWWIRVIMLVENSRAPFKLWDVKPMDGPERFDPYLRSVCLPPLSNAVGYSPQREVIEVIGNYTIPFFGPDEDVAFVGWMRYTLREMETHEMDEWIRYKGELINDPHKEV